MTTFDADISKFIWDEKYRYRLNNKVIDSTIRQSFERVAHAIASVESSGRRRSCEKDFLSILEDFQFLPGGRVLANAGTHFQRTLFNCFVMGELDDSMSGIFDALKEGALTLQQGGGVGFDFSPLRPKGIVTKTTGGIASGPVSYMKIWDQMSAATQSSGARRGAMMATMRCDHPDILEFITAKSKGDQLTQFNVSVLVTDAFMTAVDENADWALRFPDGGNIHTVIPARTLWHKIIDTAYECAEPGVLFIDTINKKNNLWYQENICCTNPCGEIPMSAYGACDLGAINLTQFVEQAFTENASINWHKLESVAIIATRFLDNVIDASIYPLAIQEQQALASRRIGLGITGLADCFLMLGILYGSQQAASISARIMQCIRDATWQTSIELSREKSPFPLLDKKFYLEGRFVKSLPSDIQQAIQKYGIRNSHHNTIAPTGTTSLLANNISSGIEPIFEASYQRNIRAISGELVPVSVQDYAYVLWKKQHQGLPPAWVDQQQLLPEHHLQMAASLQNQIDNAISKTIFIPQNYPLEKCRALYSKAYALGLKGCTIFRPNPITGSVISQEKDLGRAGHCCDQSPLDDEDE